MLRFYGPVNPMGHVEHGQFTDALILLKVCRRIYYCKIQVKFDIGYHPQNFGPYGLFST